MPLVVFSINTAFNGITDTVAQGMERDGSFRLRHYFDMPPHDDTEYTLKHVFINVSGDGRLRGDRGENKAPSAWVDVKFPNLTDDMIISKRHARTVDASTRHGDDTAIKKGTILDDRGQIRFPITQFPVNGNTSNNKERWSASDRGSHYEFRGTHICNIPLGRMKLEDGEIECVLTPRDRYADTFATTTRNPRRVRIRSIQVVLEYK